MVKEMIEAGIAEEKAGVGEPIPVVIYVEPARMELPDVKSSIAAMQHSINTGVANGLRAMLETGNLLTGAKYIGIDYFRGEPAAELGSFGDYATIPAVGGGFDQVMVQVNAIDIATESNTGG